MTETMVRIAQPRYLSEIPEGTSLEHAEAGAILQGLPMTPQGRNIAGVLAAEGTAPILDRKTGEPTGRCRPLYRTVVVEVGRRATKTTSIQNELLGRCLKIPGYRVVSTAQDGTRASAFMRDMMTYLEAENPDRSARGWTPYNSQGREEIRFDNGSIWWVVKPEPGAFRGRAADVMWFDEAGELSPEKSADLVAGALPIMDTRPAGQLIISGTPGKVRAGLLWDYLEAGRAGKPGIGIVEYSADEHADPYSDEVLLSVHPGPGSGLTPLEILQERRENMPLPQFMAEYLCVWPPDSTTTALDLKKWAAGHCDPLAGPPPGVPWGIGFNVGMEAEQAAVAVAWIDEDGELHGQLMDHRPGVAWLPAYLAKASHRHPRVRIGYDSIGPNIAAAQALARVPKFRERQLKALTFPEVKAGTSLLAQSVEALTFHHPEDASLDTSAGNAAWRESNGSRLFQRKAGRDISPLLAMVHAAAIASTEKRRSSLEMPAAMTG